MDISKKIKFFRKNRGLTQAELANLTGISLTSIKQYELGKVKPKYKQMEKIAQALMVSEIVFYDFNIETVGDVISILFALDDAIDIEFDGQKKDNESNEYVVGSVSLKFKDTHLKEFMAQWAEMKEHLKTVEDELSNIKESSIQEIVKKDMDEKYQKFKNLYNVNMYKDIIIKKGTKGIQIRTYNASKDE